MAIKVQGITVIDDGRNIINGIGASFSGIITANTFDGNFSGDGSNITGLATNLSELTNDVGFVTFTNNNQLTNGAGFITTSFTNTNQLTNGAGFVTFTNNNQLTNGAGYITTSFTDTNQLTNGAGFITTSFTNTNQLTNGAGFVTFTNNNQLTNGAGFVTFTNNDQLTNGAGYITTSFTNTNQLTNGAGFITTSFTDTNQLTNGAGFITNNVTGIITATTFDGNFSGNLTGIASTATKLETSRNFSITGDFVTASSISFDGTDNVSLAATITTDSIALGTYTTGDYVDSISGTGNQITVTSGTGEGSTPVISIPNNPTFPGTTVTVATDLQVNRNLNVTGNVTIGGTSATIFAETLKITDADLVLGFRTDANGNDISNDTTASHGGIAIASTEGTPLVSIIGAGETLPITYKKIMWFESGAFTGLATDAWLTNYAFGVGTTSMSAGTKFAVGNIETDFDDITSVVNINSSGVITATTFSGNLPTTDLTGTITNAQLAGSIANDKLVNSSVSYGGIELSLGGTDATPAFNLSDATDYPTSSLSGTITNAQLDGSIANDKLANSSIAIGGVTLNLGDTDATPAFDLSDATAYPYASLTGITTEIVGDTSPQLGGNLDLNSNNITGTGDFNVTGVITATTFSGSGASLTDIPNGALTNSSIAIGGVTLNLGDTDATPAFNLSDATDYPTSSLSGTITNAQLDGSIANDKLANSSIAIGGVTLNLGDTDATPAFDLSDATAYPYASLTGITTEIVGDTTPQLGGNLDLNSNNITGTGDFNVTGVVTATTFSGSGASLTDIPNGALTNSSIAIGGVTLNLGDTDATPAFDLSDATAYPYASLTGISTSIVGDTSPELGGNLDLNSNNVTGTGDFNVTGVVTATTFSGSGASLTDIPNGALTNSSIAIGGVTLNLGDTDATPAFNLSDAINLTGASAATYGDASNVAQIVVDANGRITGISNVTISGGDTVSITTTAADILSVSSGAISADDAGADKIVFWDDSEGKLTYLTVGTNLTVTDTTISASGGGGSGPDPVIMGMIF